MLRDLDRLGNRETPTILSVLVLEDLVMAVYLPTRVPSSSGPAPNATIAVTLGIVVLMVVLIGALRYGDLLSRAVAARSDEALLLSVVGLTLLVAGGAQELNISAAVGAFLVGIALSGSVQSRATVLIDPLRDLFAALFFLFFGLQIDPEDFFSALGPAVALAVVTAPTKYWTGVWAARRAGVGPRGRIRAGAALIARRVLDRDRGSASPRVSART